MLSIKTDSLHNKYQEYPPDEGSWYFILFRSIKCIVPQCIRQTHPAHLPPAKVIGQRHKAEDRQHKCQDRYHRRFPDKNHRFQIAHF